MLAKRVRNSLTCLQEDRQCLVVELVRSVQFLLLFALVPEGQLLSQSPETNGLRVLLEGIPDMAGSVVL